MEQKNQAVSWDKYWQGTSQTGAFASGGVSHPAVNDFWVVFFNNVNSNYTHPKILDVATGNGAVVKTALRTFGDIPNEVSCLDISPAAIENIQSSFPQVKGFVSDAASIDMQSGTFDIVTSQYGVEYAGADAVIEAARLVMPKGVLALLMHCKSGYIHKECEQSLDAIIRLQNANFIPLALNVFKSAFEAMNGKDRQPYEAAALQLMPAISELENIMREYGNNVAGDTICKLYNDVSDIHKNIKNYALTDISSWLNKMDEELEAYAERMSTMINAAISLTTMQDIKAKLIAQGFTLEMADKLYAPNNELALAWVIVAKK